MNGHNTDRNHKNGNHTDGDSTNGGNTNGDNTNGDNTNGGNTNGGNMNGNHTNGNNMNWNDMNGNNTNGSTTPNVELMHHDPLFYIEQIKSNIQLLSGIPQGNVTVIIFSGPGRNPGLSYVAKALAACSKHFAHLNYARTHNRISWNTKGTFIELADSDARASPEGALKDLMENTMISVNIHWFNRLVPPGNNCVLV